MANDRCGHGAAVTASECKFCGWTRPTCPVTGRCAQCCVRAQRVRLHVYESAAARFASHFLNGDDRLSRVASELTNISDRWIIAASEDAAFDGGEWSGAACDEARVRDLERAMPDWFDAELAQRLSARTIYFLGL